MPQFCVTKRGLSRGPFPYFVDWTIGSSSRIQPPHFLCYILSVTN
jgi:hypothetical protein